MFIAGYNSFFDILFNSPATSINLSLRSKRLTLRECISGSHAVSNRSSLQMDYIVSTTE